MDKHFQSRPSATLAVLVTLLIGVFCQSMFAQSSSDKALLEEAAQHGPAVAAVLEMPRTEPADGLFAVFTLLDLGEPQVASVLLQPVLSAKLDQQTRAALVDRFGTARFLRLARMERPSDETTDFSGALKFVEACLAAAQERAQDPRRIAKLIADLNDPSAEIRYAAIVDLKATGIHGAAACFHELARLATTASDDPTDEPEYRRSSLLHALAALRPAADPLILAGLAEGTGQLRIDLAELCVRQEVLTAASTLAALANGAGSDPAVSQVAQDALKQLGLSRPSSAEAATLLHREIDRLEARLLQVESRDDSMETVWLWNAETQQLQGREVSSEQGLVLVAARLARLLGRLEDAGPQDRHLALIYAYQQADLLGDGVAGDARQLADSLPIAEVNETLAEAVRRGHFSAAIACIKLLGERGDTEALASSTGLPTILAQLVKHPNRRLRYAALQSVMQISPQSPFAGSSAVPRALWNFVAVENGEHLDQAAQALAWIAQLLESKHPYDELLRNAQLAEQSLFQAELTEASLNVLTALGTSGSQLALLDFASQTGRSIELRRRAAEAFAQSVGRFGKRLTTKQIRTQYQRYNASELADAAVQELLGQLLDTIESPGRTASDP